MFINILPQQQLSHAGAEQGRKHEDIGAAGQGEEKVPREHSGFQQIQQVRSERSRTLPRWKLSEGQGRCEVSKITENYLHELIFQNFIVVSKMTSYYFCHTLNIQT